MKRIKIDIDGDLKSSIAEIDNLIKQIKELPNELAKSGAEMTNYSPYPVSVQASKGTIIASGEEVGFAEYGTGVLAESDPDAPIPTGYGTWSGSPEGKQILINKGYWYYNKKRLTGTAPTRALRTTIEYLKQNGAEMLRSKIK